VAAGVGTAAGVAVGVVGADATAVGAGVGVVGVDASAAGVGAGTAVGVGASVVDVSNGA
jgi:hypothetical protein